MNEEEKYIGQMLDDRYEILETIGEGGMAIVFRALDHRLNRYVAVKIMREEMDSVDVSARNPMRLPCCPIRISSRSTT